MNTMNKREREKEMYLSGAVVNLQVCEVKGQEVDDKLGIFCVVDCYLNWTIPTVDLHLKKIRAKTVKCKAVNCTRMLTEEKACTNKIDRITAPQVW
ncbi:hypothetical protein ACTXT7_015505 [Hymenolepis weldensis]